MNIFDFLTQDEIDDLPDNDPDKAFTTFVRIAQRRLGEHTSQLDEDDQYQWRQIEDARYGFINVVIAAAKKFGIKPFATMEVPKLTKFDAAVHRQFKADLDHYLTQLLLGDSSRAKQDSVFISPDLKTSIRTYVHHLKDAIDRANLDEDKRSALHSKLASFEAELEKKRVSLSSVALFTIAILTAPSGIWATGELGTKLVTNILRSIDEAKSAEDRKQSLPPPESPLAITGPRTEETEETKLDDEIPF